nr:ABC transporter permease [uncultured Roseateles sp.]
MIVLHKSICSAGMWLGMRARACLVLVLLGWVQAHAQVSSEACGSLAAVAGRFGPFDYRADHFKPPFGESRPHGQLLKLVNDAHFSPEAEALIRGVSTTIGGDLSFALRAFPNHHRALLAMMRLGEKLKTQQPKGAEFPVECWFERAIRFQPDDTIVRMMYAIYLHKNDRLEEARGQLDLSVKMAGDNAFTHYNAGLIYFDIKDYDKALAQAHTALKLGLRTAGLSEQLKAQGKWQEPADAVDIGAAAEPASSPAAPLPAASQPQGTR